MSRKYEKVTIVISYDDYGRPETCIGTGLDYVVNTLTEHLDNDYHLEDYESEDLILISASLGEE
tara:strand:+ start:3831 stop:4022 length:192 start_codon:yes stop_codon:yes gene_type:complete